jgi:hypothetical protein
MALPRFAHTPFTTDVFHRAAEEIPRQKDGQRAITFPHPCFLVPSAIENFDSDALADVVHIGWQSILIEAEDPIALFQAVPNMMGELVNVSTIRGELPATIVRALAETEHEKLVAPHDDFAVVSVPQSALIVVWLPASRTVVSVGPDLHRQMPKGMPRPDLTLMSAVLESVTPVDEE